MSLRWFVQRRDDEDGEVRARSEDLMEDGGGGHAAVLRWRPLKGADAFLLHTFANDLLVLSFLSEL